MKTIQFTAGDGFDYTILTTSITYLSPDKKNGGTWIELSSATRLYTKIEINTLVAMLK
ncbi:hypothetical protein [Flavobacterium sp.]|uniref:hypothetical protein n=1 Tax=Flavobacterium sp. TaxID=239 RepID=UPI004047FFA1